MNKIPNNCESQEFPYHSNFGDKYPYSIKPKAIRKNLLSHFYNNETPDAFRLSHMKWGQNLYNNPYIKIPPIDREENFKDLQVTRKIIKYIDHIKSHPKLSQDQSLLKKIRDENYYRQKTNLFKSNSQKEFTPKMNLERCLPNEGNEQKEEYQNTIYNLYKKYTKPMTFKLRNQIDRKNHLRLGDLEFSDFDAGKVQKLTCPLTVKESNYLANIHNYDIKDNYKPSKRCFFEFKRKPYEIYDPILNKHKIVQPDNILVDKWDNNEEAFELLKGNLGRKGEYFSEFTTKNKCIFDMNRAIKMQKKKDEQQKASLTDFKF